MKLTDEQWVQLEEICQDIARAAGARDPMPWNDSPFFGPGIRSLLSDILEVEDQYEVLP